MALTELQESPLLCSGLPDHESPPARDERLPGTNLTKDGTRLYGGEPTFSTEGRQCAGKPTLIRQPLNVGFVPRADIAPVSG